MISSASSSLDSYINSLGSSTVRKRSSEDMFKKVDSDSDGTINKDELSAMAKKVSDETGVTLDISSAITNYDADGDGGLSQEEMDSFMKDNAPRPSGAGGPKAPQGMFKQVDSDSDGVINEEELTAMAENMSSEMGVSLDVSNAISDYDADGDGGLNEEEMDSFMKDNAPKPPDNNTNKAVFSYGTNMNEEQLSSLLDLLNSNNSSSSDDSTNTTTSSSPSYDLTAILSSILSNQSTVSLVA
ncbi:MAG: EF-hand domain-containing protein [Candidatus Magnetoovum sp. WYHC-5]|nr:EF-hand domain-containing protein [Candidatus Magnetoovum sp. WYHC-5]